MTTKSDTLAASMVAAFAEIEGATKDKVNPAFKSKYADLGSVIDAIRPVLARHNLAFEQHCHPAEDGVSIETFVRHSAGEKESMGILYVPANKRDSQGFGSALTYARRYALMTAFGVPAEDDDGNAAAKSAPANDRTNGHKDAPFPLGPAKNLTELKTLGRAFWSDVEGCGDDDQLSALLASHVPLVNQLKAALPSWWDGGTQRSGEPFEGLGEVITRKQQAFRLVDHIRA
jgi:hypothetical protein